MLYHGAFNSVEAIVEEEVIEENSSVPLCDYQNPPGFELNFCFIVLWYD